MIEFIVGAAGSGKTSRCYKEIEKQLQIERFNHLIVLVPEQFNLQVQMELAERFAPGLLRVEVVSFNNLAEHVLKESGEVGAPLIDDLERVMILKKVLEEHKGELDYFKKSYQSEGFLESMNRLITVFEQNGIQDSVLQSIRNSEYSNSIFGCKMGDFSKIYEWFNTYIHEKFSTVEKTMERLAKAVSGSTYLSQSMVWVDGFYGFTQPQQAIIREMMHTAEHFVLTLPMDEVYAPDIFILPSHPFYDSIINYRHLIKVCEEDKLEYRPTYLPPRTSETPLALEYLRDNYLKPYSKKYPHEQTAIQVQPYTNKEEEIEAVAKEIQKLIREDGYRYHDFAVLVGDLGNYKASLVSVFKEYDIPVFIDAKRSIHSNTLVAVIQALLDVVIGGFTYKGIMSLLRMNMLKFTLEEVDILENYLLENGIKGIKKWQVEWTKESKHVTEEQINALRKRVLEYIEPFKVEIEASKNTKGHLTIKSATIAIYHFLERIEAYEVIQERIVMYQAIKEVALERENTQIWGEVINVFERLVDLLGEEYVALTTYRNLLKTSFSYIKMGIIPPSKDQVIVGTIERTRIPSTRAVFVLGVNEGMVPKVDESMNLFSDRDKSTLSEICNPKKGEGETDVLKERLGNAVVNQPLYAGSFLIYATLTHASEKLYVSTYQADDTGKSQRPSLVYYKMKKLFGEKVCLKNELDDIQAPIPTLGYVGSKLRTYLEVQNEEAVEAEESVWKDTLSWYMEQEIWKKRILMLVKDFGYTAKQDYLKEENAKKLYPNGLETSISQLEAYRNCPCCYFIKYGIKAEERRLLEWNMADVGTLFHATLERYPKELANEEVSWVEATQEQLELCVKRAVGYSVSRSTYANKEDAKIKYTIKRIEKMSTRAIKALTYQLQQGDFTPEAYEVNFGYEGLPAIEIKLDDEQTVLLKGQIDRVDVYMTEDGTRYIKILDYKTSQKNFSLLELYHSLQLQLLLYLDSYLRLNPNNKPAGMFYFHIDTKSIKYEMGMQASEVAKKQMQQFKLSGLALDDVEIIESLEHGVRGEIIPATKKKDGTLSATASVATEGQFNELRNYMMTCIKTLATDILAGKISAKPCKLKEKEACTYCKYQTICQFDQKSIENSYEKLETLKDKQVWERICPVEKGGEK